MNLFWRLSFLAAVMIAFTVAVLHLLYETPRILAVFCCLPIVVLCAEAITKAILRRRKATVYYGYFEIDGMAIPFAHFAASPDNACYDLSKALKCDAERVRVRRLLSATVTKPRSKDQANMILFEYATKMVKK